MLVISVLHNYYLNIMIDVLKTLNLDDISLMTKHTPVRRIVKRSVFDICINYSASSIGYLYKA